MRRSGHHVLLTVPTRGSVTWQTATMLEAARDYTPGLRPILYQPGNLSVALTRNLIVRQFLATDCTTLVMVDDDVVVPANFIEILDPFVGDYGMVALPHPATHPTEPGRLFLTAYDEVEGGWLKPRTRLVEGINEVAAVATGCVAVSRSAIEALGPAPFRIAHDPDENVTSDDFPFCAALRAAGFKIGAFWGAGMVDHVNTVCLMPLLERQMARQEERV